MAAAFTYISDGRLHVVRDGRASEHESPFIRDKIAELERERSFKGYTAPRAARDGEDAHPNPFQVWGGQARVRRDLRHRFLQARIAGGRLLYLLRFNDCVGMFRFDPGGEGEDRLFHKNDLDVRGFDWWPDPQRFVFEIANPDGSSDLYLADGEGRLQEQLTGGDSVDCHPRFLDAGTVVFASAGLARQDGAGVAERTPFRLMSCSIASKAVEELQAVPGQDLLLPGRLADGRLAALQRPYRPLHDGGPLAFLKALVLLPLHLLLALLGFLQGFIRLFGRRDFTLVGPNLEQRQQRPLALFSQAVKASRDRSGEIQLPREYRVVAFPAGGGAPAVLGEGVSCLSCDGDTPILAAGSAIRATGGEVLFKAPREHLVEQLSAGTLR